MKTLVIAFACLLLPGLTLGQCGLEVQAPGGVTFQPSSPNVRVTVMLSGRPAPGARINVYEWGAENHAEFSVSTGADGIGTLPALTPGIYYHVVAVGDHGMRSDIYLKVTEDAKNGASGFPMDLGWSPVVPERSQLLAAEGMSASSTVKDLTGVVRDESGAVIPNAFVDVWKKGTTDGPPLEEIRSDNMGRFSAHLQDGTYIAFFSSAGFRGNTVVFEVANMADLNDLQVVLRVHACT